MHIEKNVFEQIINILMNVKGKSKEEINSRKDLVMFYKCRKLNVKVTDGDVGARKEVMPTAPYMLRTKGKCYVNGYVA